MPTWECSQMWREGRFYTFSQNFIVDPNLVKRLLNQADISVSDTVVDIGAGKGVITKALSKRCAKVIAVEADYRLYQKLTRSMKSNNLVLINKDFLKVVLPKENYKVFSNIPFNYTSRIMKKLFYSDHPPAEAYLTMQREAGNVYLGYPCETQKSLLLKPFFKVDPIFDFKKTDFNPRPAVDIVLLKISKFEKPLIESTKTNEYRDFVVYGTTQRKSNLKKSLAKIITHEQFKRLAKVESFSVNVKPLDITYLQWVNIFEYYIKHVVSEKKSLVKGSYFKQQQLQRRLKKSYRTRV